MSMYDASLDAINPHRWRKDFYRNEPGNILRNSGRFTRAYPYRKYYPVKSDFGTNQTIIYPHIYGFSFHRRNHYALGLEESMPTASSIPMGKRGQRPGEMDDLSTKNVDAIIVES